MPELDGFETTNIIRERDAQNETHTPIIALTALAMKGDKERCEKAGMDDYIRKPIEVVNMFSTIYKVLKRLDKLPQKAPSNPQITH